MLRYDQLKNTLLQWRHPVWRTRRINRVPGNKSRRHDILINAIY